MTVTPELILADYDRPDHAAAVISLMDMYARDPMGGNSPLSENVKARLIDELKARSFTFTILAFVEGEAVGLINMIEGFSTFKANPLINLHDIAVAPDARGKGIARAMMTKAAAFARSRGCCKLTLEVLTGNAPARTAYENFGFVNYELDPATGHAIFMELPLN